MATHDFQCHITHYRQDKKGTEDYKHDLLTGLKGLLRIHDEIISPSHERRVGCVDSLINEGDTFGWTTINKGGFAALVYLPLNANAAESVLLVLNQGGKLLWLRRITDGA